MFDESIRTTGVSTIKLVMDRASLFELDVPDDVPAVVIISRPGQQDHVLPIGLIRDVITEFDRQQSEARRQGTNVYDVGSKAKT